VDPSRVVIDHVNEETVKEVKDRGFWAAFSIYPHSKMTAERMFEIVRAYGPERLIVDSACDWGVSDPLSVPKTAKLLAERGIQEDHIRLVTYANALAVYGESDQMREEDWLSPAAIDQRTLYQGNTVLRGGQIPVVGRPS
jgi:predicted metal-dependent TIM-barrel fold hydrolase